MAIIDIIVGGRFHADRLCEALLEQGHDVQLITPFPKSKFPRIPKDKIKSLVAAELVYRVCRKTISENFADELKMKIFGLRASQNIRATADFIFAWSSFGLESFRKTSAKKILLRDSSHIETQMVALKTEWALRGKKFSIKANGVARELYEYDLCDKLILLSQYAKQSFLDRGFSENKIFKVSLGADLSLFHPEFHQAKLPLKVVYFGSLSYHKGILYLLDAFKNISPSVATLDLIGAFTPDMSEHDIPKHVTYHSSLKHSELAIKLREYDVFVFPTLDDGFGQTLLQAMASGLVPIVTTNCGAAEIIEDGKNGFVIPVASSHAIEDCVKKLAADLNLVKQIREAVAIKVSAYSWENYASQIKRVIASF